MAGTFADLQSESRQAQPAVTARWRTKAHGDVLVEPDRDAEVRPGLEDPAAARIGVDDHGVDHRPLTVDAVAGRHGVAPERQVDGRTGNTNNAAPGRNVQCGRSDADAVRVRVVRCDRVMENPAPGLGGTR